MQVTENREVSNAPWVVFVSDFPFFPPAHGSYARVLEMTQAIRGAGFKIRYVFWEHHGRCDPSHIAGMRRLVDDFVLIPWQGTEGPEDDDSLAWGLVLKTARLVLPEAARDWGRPIVQRLLRIGAKPPIYDYSESTLDDWCPENLRDVIATAVTAGRTVAAIGVYAFMAPGLAPFGDRGVLRIIDTQDVLHRRLENFKNNGMEPSGFLVSRNSEAHLLDQADILLAIQQEEANTFSEMVSPRKVMLLEHGMSVPDASKCTAANANGKDVVLIASDNPFNRKGLEWFIREVWRAVLRREPQASLHVFGRLAGTDICQGPRIHRRGFVADVAEAYGLANAVINPVHIGTGLKIKTVEALLFGKPTVTTSVGAEGIADASDIMIVADTPEAFAAGLTDLLSQPAKAEMLGRKARQYAEHRFSHSQVYKPLISALRERAGVSAGCDSQPLAV